MKNNSLYLCVHVLQVMPACCINRDDTGTPKSMMYGGKRRMRVSSQCWKRAVRMYLKNKYGDTGVRKKNIVECITKRICTECECDKDKVKNNVKAILSGAGITAKDKKDTIAFFSLQQVEAIYNIIMQEGILIEDPEKERID